MLSVIFKVLPVVLPAVIDAVRLIEKLFGSGGGSEKRSAVVDIAKIVIRGTEYFSKKDLVDDEKFAGGIGKVVDGIVDMLNATGEFQEENL